MEVKSVVIDTNVLISSALSIKGVPAQVVRHFVLHSKICFSEETFEFSSRLWPPKFDRYISRERRKSILFDFSNIAEWVEISGELKLCRDPDDNKSLELAIKASATMLVSGDRDLTDMKNIEDIPIYTPAQCLELIVKKKG
jgi:putative PIN family toxin of toxin-antitoxin system